MRADDHLMQHRIEDVTFLCDHGTGLTDAAKRLDIDRESLRTFLTRHKQDALYRALLNNDY